MWDDAWIKEKEIQIKENKFLIGISALQRRGTVWKEPVIISRRLLLFPLYDVSKNSIYLVISRPADSILTGWQEAV